MIRLGRASLPILSATCARISSSKPSGSSPEPSRVTKATIAWPVSSSWAPMHAASATRSWDTIADSTSIVDMRWPETLITSSTRPTIQR